MGARAELILAVAAAAMAAVWAQSDTLGGYTFVVEPSEMFERAKLDLDQAEIDALTSEATPKFGTSKELFTTGKHSSSDDGLRSIRGFCNSEGAAKMEGEPQYELFAKYYGDETYAETFVVNALDGEGDFSDLGDGENVIRGECANKGMQYQCVVMYTIHELESSVKACLKNQTNPLPDGESTVKGWDEGWAFYAGSSIGTDGENAENGWFQYTLANKRAEDFAMEGESINAQILTKFRAGQEALIDGDCEAAEDLKSEIVNLMKVPLVQGMLRYAYRADPNAGFADAGAKEWAEGWAFTAAILPWVDEASSKTADLLVRNFGLQQDSPMQDGYREIFSAMDGIYSDMGIDSGDVGTLTEAVEGEDGGEVVDDDEGGLSAGAKAGIAIGVIALVVTLIAGLLYLLKRRKSHYDTSMDKAYISGASDHHIPAEPYAARAETRV